MSDTTSIVLSIQDKVGGLVECLQVVQKHKLNMTAIHSKRSSTRNFDYDFHIDIETHPGAELSVEQMLQEIRGSGAEARKLTEDRHDNGANVPWFPSKISDLDQFANKVLELGKELDTDHPGYTDATYRERRKEIVEIACQYKHGQEIPRVKYTPDEIATWGVVYKKLTHLFPTHACKQHRDIFPLLEQYCNYSETSIPQLQDVSNFLKQRTGFTLRPVAGLLSPRDFLNGLAFRVFHATQYIRHHNKPLYTPEPDICHELLGHAPLFANQAFANFSQELGLASLGASDEDIKKLSTCYWFTVEFGLCKEGDTVKAYGAGLLSSFGELEHSLSGKPQLKPFDPFFACQIPYPITEYQPTYFVAESFLDVQAKLRVFISTFSSSGTILRYNPYTQSIDTIDSKDKVASLAASIKSETSLLASAINYLK